VKARRCKGCYQNVELHTGCSVGRVVINGVTYQRVRWQAVDGERCGGCGTIANGYHHIECGVEACPACGKVRCGCRVLRSIGPRPLLPEDEPWEGEFDKP
jgi:hypothetical protein